MATRIVFFLCALVVMCICAHSAKAEGPGPINKKDLYAKEPIKLLDQLVAAYPRGQKIFRLTETDLAPDSWLRADYVPALLLRLDSKRPSAKLSIYSDGPYTEAWQAAYLLNGYAFDRFPPPPGPSLLDTKDLRKWARFYLDPKSRRFLLPAAVTSEEQITRHTPAEFLNCLKVTKQAGISVIDVRDMPICTNGIKKKDWIQKNDVEILAKQLSSNEPASGIWAPFNPDNLPCEPSNVGNEAAFLILGYIEKRFPPRQTSSFSKRDREANMKTVRAWLMKNNIPVPKDSTKK